MRFFRVARSAFLAAAAVLGGLCIVGFVLVAVFKITPAIVVAGSMEPTISVGSMTFARNMPAEDVSVGDIVTVARANDDTLVTHRVVDKTVASDGVTQLTLKGDASSSNDPSPYHVQTVGKVIASVPYLGNVAGFFKTPIGYVAIALVAAALVLAFVVPVRPRRQVRKGDPIEAEALAIAAGKITGVDPRVGAQPAVAALIADPERPAGRGAPASEAPSGNAEASAADVDLEASETTMPRHSRGVECGNDLAEVRDVHPFDEAARPEVARPEAARHVSIPPGRAVSGPVVLGPGERPPSRRRARQAQSSSVNEIDVDTRQGPFPPRRSARR